MPIKKLKPLNMIVTVMLFAGYTLLVLFGLYEVISAGYAWLGVVGLLAYGVSAPYLIDTLLRRLP